MAFLFKGTPKSETEFDVKWTEYKGTIELLKKLEEQLKAHMEQTKKYIASAAELSIQIANFYAESDDPVMRRTRAFGTLNAQLERIQLTSANRLLEDEVLQPMGVLWHHDKEIHKAVRERKRLIALEAKKLKAMNAKQAELKAATDQDRKDKEKLIVMQQQGKTVKLKKRKSITEYSKELIEKEVAYEDTVQKQNELTDTLFAKFKSLESSRKNGELLSSPICGIVSAEYHLVSQAVEKLNGCKNEFREHAVFNRLLQQYDSEQLNGILVEKDVAKSTGFVFGRMLTITTPDVVCDCIAFIRMAIRTEGLFRIPGNRTKVERIQESYDSNDKNILNSDKDIDIHDVCSTLKFYFNSMPEPLIPYDFYEQLEAYFDAEENEGKFDDQEIISIIQRVPKPQIALLGILLNFLYDVKKEAAYNQMTSSNLATCFAPVLLKSRPDNKNMAGIKSIKNIAANIATVELLIDNARKFYVPKQQLIREHTNITEATLNRIGDMYKNAIGQHELNRLNPIQPPTQAGEPDQAIQSDFNANNVPPKSPFGSQPSISRLDSHKAHGADHEYQPRGAYTFTKEDIMNQPSPNSDMLSDLSFEPNDSVQPPPSTAFPNKQTNLTGNRRPKRAMIKKEGPRTGSFTDQIDSRAESQSPDNLDI